MTIEHLGMPKPLPYLAHRLRQLIEVVNAQLQGQFAIEHTLAKTLWARSPASKPS